jgi:6-pyruvoyltetrahydropterin/6-carboxytetrahydropterin synthase
LGFVSDLSRRSAAKTDFEFRISDLFSLWPHLASLEAFDMYTLSVDSFFWVAHSVPLPDGSAEPPHSHNFCAAAKITAPDLDEKGMIMDFCRLRQLLDGITAGIAAAGNIGRIDYFAHKPQTAEFIAKYIFERLRPALPQGVSLRSLTVTEDPLCRATYAQ